MATIRNPAEWTAGSVKSAFRYVGAAGRAVRGSERVSAEAPPELRRIGLSDLKDALARGFEDFKSYRTDVVFLCLIYPIAGLLLWRLAFGYNLLPLIFPLASGFALIGPLAAVGLYEMSRKREEGVELSWREAFGVVSSPSFGAIVALGVLLIAVFLIWLLAAYVIYMATLGPEAPASLGAFLNDVLTTPEGWAMTVVGVGVGAVFAAIVLTLSVVSFPLLLDRDVGLGMAMITSVRATLANPVPVFAWGLIVAGLLLLGSLPLLVGLVVALPVLGHATWHLYRKLVVRSPLPKHEAPPAA